ncbi:hypothetical protein ZWY2020_031106 [Hordeum vulgare]|nr:hypothetical protein ZWY2020_031106 [Hordeum vulgare]
MDNRNNSASVKDVTQTKNVIQNTQVRILRSRDAKKPPSNSVDTLVKPTAKKRRRKRPTVSGPEDELSRIHKKIKYFFSRISYHKTFVKAYARKGWKNQSAEKIRPEKELERAKADIVRCKLKVREAVQNIDHLLTVGKPDESLFDSEGNISSDNIVCATCSLQDDTLDNDIILCDGACKRGFHQNCLNPPLATKDIPEEEWICPGCACKIQCIKVVNELQGTALSINDSWEKVFPEAAAVAHRPMQSDVQDLPSDDSEDDNFDPNISKESSEEDGSSEKGGSSEEDGDEGSDSDDSNGITYSDNLEHVKEKEKFDDLGLPSEDSEDDDYDPAAETDFTSESDDFCANITKSCGKDDVSSGPKYGEGTNDLEGAIAQPNTSMSHLTTKDLEMDQDVILPSRRRQVQRLDYQKNYDVSSTCMHILDINFADVSGLANTLGIILHCSVNRQHTEELLTPNTSTTCQKRHYGPIINQMLYEQFKIDKYPSRAIKESLAQELGLTFRQVEKWFENRRRHIKKASNKNSTPIENHTTRETMVENPNVCKSDAVNEDMPSEILNEGITQDGPLKQGICGGTRTNASPPNSSPRYTIHYVRSQKGESSKGDHGTNTSSWSAGLPKSGDAESAVLALEVVDKKKPNKMLQELKKRKIS